MDFFFSMELSIPVMQIILLLILSSVAILFGRKKLALIINFLFTMYWGYFLSIDQFTLSGLKEINYYFAIYFGIGLLIVILALIGFLRDENKTEDSGPDI
jgi:hypothetical protein